MRLDTYTYTYTYTSAVSFHIFNPYNLKPKEEYDTRCKLYIF
jgi:hypothetical protein